MINLSKLEPLVRVVTTSGTPVNLAPYQVAITISFTANAGVSADTINDSSSGFLTAGFKAGDKVVVSGSTSNDGTYLVDTVTAGVLTLNTDERLPLTEIAGDTVTLTAFYGRAISDGVEVTVRALPTNTGNICLASSSARALNTNTNYERHMLLANSESLQLQVKNLDSLWIDSTVSGDGVEIIYEA